MLNATISKTQSFVERQFPLKQNRSLEEALNERTNNLNFIRLCAALLVIVDHAFPLSNRPHWLSARMGFTLGALAVHTFFFISGLLITRSWLDDPKLINFFIKRTSRILPGLFVAILFTAFVIGPLVTTLSLHEYAVNPLTRQYIFNNFKIFPIQYSLPGVFENNPYPVAVNGSIWSLPLELFAYLCVLMFGITRLLKHRYIMFTLFIALIYINLHVVPSGKLLGNNGIWFFMPTQQLWLLMLTFSFGAICYLFKEKIRLNVLAGFLSIGIFILLFNTGTSTVALTFIWGYILLVFGLQNWPICQKSTSLGDFSYGIYIYAFPIQQLVMYKWPSINPFIQILLVIPVTYVLAMLSWYLVEKPSLKLKKVLPKSNSTSHNIIKQKSDIINA